MMAPWTGDLDGMIARRVIRVLTVYSKTFYFMDKGVQRGTTYDIFQLFETDLNKKLAKSKTLKQKAYQGAGGVHSGPSRATCCRRWSPARVISRRPTSPFPKSAKGWLTFPRRCIATSASWWCPDPPRRRCPAWTIWRGRRSSFARPPVITTSLVALNRRFAAEKKPAVIIKEVPETLEDEDLIEMVNAGLIPLIVVDKHKADFWKRIFPKITVHDGVAVRSGGDIAWAIRKGSPQLKAALDDFATRHNARTAEVNRILTRYLKNTKYVKDAASKS